jgi:hypothetical protein
MQHGERRLQITHNRDFVAKAARREACAEKLARAPVSPQRIVDEERRNVGEAGLEHRGDKDCRLVPVDALGEDRRHRRMGMERLAPPRRRKTDRRSAEDHETARARQIGRHFQHDVAAETPADEARLREPKRPGRRADGPPMARQRIGARVPRIVRGAVPGQVDRDQAKALAERPIELARKGARGRGIAVDEDGRRAVAARLVKRDRAVGRVDHPRFHWAASPPTRVSLARRPRLKKPRTVCSRTFPGALRSREPESAAGTRSKTVISA